MCYSEEITDLMRKHHQSLSEKDKRKYAAIEAVKLGYGGIIYIARVLGVDRNTIAKGIKELKSESDTTCNQQRIRRRGGGRKSRESEIPDLNEFFLEVLKNHTAGDPMNELIKWTNLTHKEIASGLRTAGFTISLPLVAKLLKQYSGQFLKRDAMASASNAYAINHRSEKSECNLNPK